MGAVIASCGFTFAAAVLAWGLCGGRDDRNRG